MLLIEYRDLAGILGAPTGDTIMTTTIYTTAGQCIPAEGHRLVIARFKNPARMAAIAIDAGPWDRVAANAPENYREILLAVLDNSAKNILNRHLTSFSLWPSTIDAAYFCEAALIEDATGANSEWMSKDELETAWRASATRKAWVANPNYASNKDFRTAVAHYETLITKLAGKTTQYTPEQLDLMLAKMREEDLSSELGSFVVRRVEALRNKPAPASVNCDLL